MKLKTQTDAVAVLMRMIAVVEGKQKLGGEK
jgi:hypothetical protein